MIETPRMQPRVIKDIMKNRQTGTHIQIDYGLNEENYYQATCYTHGKYVNTHTYAGIMAVATDPIGWCSGCQDENCELVE